MRRRAPPTTSHRAVLRGRAKRGAGGVCGEPARRAAVTWAPRQPGAGGWAPRGWGRGLHSHWAVWQGAGGRGGTRASAWIGQMWGWLHTRPQGPQRKSSDHPGLTGWVARKPSRWTTAARPELPWASALGTEGSSRSFCLGQVTKCSSRWREASTFLRSAPS